MKKNDTKINTGQIKFGVSLIHLSKLSILFLTISLLVGCTEPEPNFAINGEKKSASDTQPSDANDTSYVVNVFNGIEVSFEDQSENKGKVTVRYWDIDGDGIWETDYQDKEYFSHTYQNTGFNKITFCANNKDNCVSKWIFIKGINDGQPDDKFVLESDPSSKSSRYKLSIQTNDIYSKEELTLVVNGEIIDDFDFDESTGILKKDIKLSVGSNSIDVRSSTDDAPSYFEIAYPGDGGGPLVGISSIKILDKDKTYSNSRREIKIQTPNYKGNDLEVQLNGVFQDNYQKSRDDIWTVNVNLTEGENNLYAKIPGTDKSDWTTITYEEAVDAKKSSASSSSASSSSASTSSSPLVTDLNNQTKVETATLKIISPEDNYTTKKENYELKIKTVGLVAKKFLSINLNGQKISKYNFDQTQRLWVADLTLQPGNNTVEVSGKFENDSEVKPQKVVIKYDKPVDLGKLGTAGLDSKKPKGTCAVPNTDNYQFTVTPKQAVELLGFTVFSSVCGGLEITLSSNLGTTKTIGSLVQGKSQISLEDLRAVLRPGTTYTLTCKTISGYANCSSEIKPKLEDASACNLKATTKPSAFTADYKGKSIIYDLKFLY